MSENLSYVKLSPKGMAPKRSTPGSAGYDLHSAEDCAVMPGSSRLISTDIAIAIPSGHYGRIAPRSSLAINYCIDIGGGVIDSDYRGNVKILLFNHGEYHFAIRSGDRIAQLILERISAPEVIEVSSLDETSRGSGGFGSTGSR